jgi:dihydrofolate synthase / folylpolyglutamate synthase
MDFDDSVRYMSGLIRFGWKLGNARIEALCERLGNPHRRAGIVHIAGTKGKGSTTALSAAILHAQGFSVGGYFSPYVYDVCERIQIDGEPIPRDDFARIVTTLRPHVEALAETEHGQTTEFELKTAAAFLYFAEREVDFACIEVGIGGRLDATNIVQPTVTVITNIGLDHTELLGDTHAKIASEKAGIVKPGIPCITATDNVEALGTIERIAAERGAPLIRVSRCDAAPTRESHRVCWSVDPEREEFGPVTIATERHVYPGISMRMGGLYQRANAACAVAAAQIALLRRGCGLDADAVRSALRDTALPGRLAIVRLAGGPLVVLDGAHNALAAEALRRAIDALRREAGLNKLRLVIGMVGGHAPDGVLAALALGAELVVACRPDWKRAQQAEEIAQAARPFAADVRVVEPVMDAVHAAAADADPRTLVLVTGSFYTVGEVLPQALEEWWRAR